MNKNIFKIGLWSAIICLISFIVWIVAFAAISTQSPLFIWTDLESYIQYTKEYNQFFQYLAKSFMIFFSLAYMILAFIFYELTTSVRKIYSKIGIAFVVMFALLSSLHYFIQISLVRFAIAGNDYAGLEHYIQSNPTSFLLALNMLGWTICLGLSSLFLYAGLFSGTVSKGIRIGLLISFLSGILGGISYLLQIDILTFIFMNLGIGFAFIIISVSAIRHFLTIRRKSIILEE